jgi:DNA mismatch repair protein MSH5
MAQIGSFVPANSAKIGLVDRIFARISSVESVSSAHSSFSIDVSQINIMVKNQTSKSLLLIDEFGKGTAPEDGVSLLAAMIRHLAKQASPPRALVSTHFQELFRFSLLFPKEHNCNDYNIEVMQMTMQPQNQNDNQLNRLTDSVPIFKMKKGVARSSHGIACAKMAGVCDEVISRAMDVLQVVYEGGEQIPPLEGVTNCLERSRTHIDILRLYYSISDWSTCPESDIKQLIGLIQLADIEDESL